MLTHCPSDAPKRGESADSSPNIPVFTNHKDAEKGIASVTLRGAMSAVLSPLYCGVEGGTWTGGVRFVSAAQVLCGSA